MPLRDLSPGEIIDRLTILNLKIDAAGAKPMWARQSAQWCEERGILEKVFAGAFPETPIQLARIGLAVINAQIWMMEDESRRGADISHRSVQMLNDARMSTIKLINEVLGAESPALEKI